MMDGFILPDSVLEKLADIVGEEHVPEIEEAVLYYCKMRSAEKDFEHKKEMNRMLKEVRQHIQAIREILEHRNISRYLMDVAENVLPDEGGKYLVGKPSPFIGGKPTLNEQHDLTVLDNICQAAINSQKEGPGVATGGDVILHAFLDKVCECCEKSSGQPLPIKDSGTLAHKVIGELSVFLQIGTCSGLIRDAIKRRRHQ